MAYNKNETYDSVIDAIIENKLKCFDYIQAYVSPCTKTLYEMFPTESDELHAIKDMLEANRINAKTKMRNKWEESDNPTLQIAAFKLMATDEERESLSTNWQKTEHSGEINIEPKEWV